MSKKPCGGNKVLIFTYIRFVNPKNRTHMKKILMTLMLVAAVSVISYAGEGDKKKKKKEATKTEQTDEKKSCTPAEGEGKSCCSKKKDA
jgi:uncharacterized membrane protein YebE (DUF533 family)